MKTIKLWVMLTILTLSIEANHKILYYTTELGIIKDFTSIEQHYLKANITSSIVRWAYNKDFLILYDAHSTIIHSNDIKYKQDNHGVLSVVKYLLSHTVKIKKTITYNKEQIVIIKENDHYNFEFISEGKHSTGTIKISNGILIYMRDFNSHISIELIQ